MNMFFKDQAEEMPLRYLKENWKVNQHKEGLDECGVWTNLDSYETIKRTAENRHLWRSCTSAACLPSGAEDS